jgi:hypothetical protein
MDTYAIRGLFNMSEERLRQHILLSLNGQCMETVGYTESEDQLRGQLLVLECSIEECLSEDIRNDAIS